MASGDTLAVLYPADNIPPSGAFATFDTIAAATGFRAVLDFDDTTSETAIFEFVMPRHYGGSGVTVYLHGSMAGANTGTAVVGLEVAFERVADTDALGAAGSDFAAANSVEITVDNTANNKFSGSLAFTDGADMDSCAAGDLCRVKVTRKTAGLSGTNATGDFQLHALEIKET